MKNLNKIFFVCLLISIMMFSIFFLQGENNSVINTNSPQAQNTNQENNSIISTKPPQTQDANQEINTFYSQEIQPIEDNPKRFYTTMSSKSNLHSLSVEKPDISETVSINDIINSILNSAVNVKTLENQELLDCINFDLNGEGSNDLLSIEDEYIRASVQINNNKGVCGNIHFGGLSASSGISGNSNTAVLFKYRSNGISEELALGLSNNFVRTSINTRGTAELTLRTDNDNNRYIIDTVTKEYPNSFNHFNEGWYYTLLAIDKSLGYRCITWQENDPQNYVFYACKLGDIYKTNSQSQIDFSSYIDYCTKSDEFIIDVESLTIYKFDNFNNIDIDESNAIVHNYEYSNDYEKYQLAVDLFKKEDYYNSYLLLKELDGYSTSESYLTECERLLATVEISGNLANAVYQSMIDQEMTIYDYLYVYQAEKLESLNLSYNTITDLSFLELFPNLKELNLEGNIISDLTPLYNLKNLEHLDLSNNTIEDITGLNGLVSLKELDLSFNNLYSIAGLYTLKNIEQVDLSNTYICNVNALNNSPIKELDITNTNINSLGAVASLSDLEVLKAGVKTVRGGNDVERLSLKDTTEAFWLGLTGLEFLTGHQNLKHLELNRLEAGYDEDCLEPLTTMPKLEALHFYLYNGWNGANSLAKLTNLKELTLDSWMYGFGDTTFLKNLTDLKKLSILSYCNVEDLAVFENLINLTELRMYQYADDLTFLSPLKNLRLLELIDWNDLSDFSPLQELDNLKYLDMSGIELDHISSVFELEKLEYLKIDSWQNNVGSLEGIQKLRNLKNLDFKARSCSDRQVVDQDAFLNSFDTLKCVTMVVLEGENSCGYSYGDYYIRDTIKEPSIEDIKFPEHTYFSIWNNQRLEELKYYNNVQNINISIEESFPYNENEIITLKIPVNARRIYISSSIKDKVNLELDCTDCIGLETLVIGEIYRENDPYGWGKGAFAIENLDGVSNCVSLRNLYINSARVNDIIGLTNCKNLRIVQLRNNNITDVSALKNKIYLRNLDMSGNSITNMNELDSCLRLEN